MKSIIDLQFLEWKAKGKEKSKKRIAKLLLFDVFFSIKKIPF